MRKNQHSGQVSQLHPSESGVFFFVSVYFFIFSFPRFADFDRNSNFGDSITQTQRGMCTPLGKRCLFSSFKHY